VHALLLSLPMVDETFEVTTTSSDGGGLFAGLMIVTLGLLLLSLLSTVFWIWMLVDAAKAPEHAWAAIGQNKTLWIILAVFPLGVIASLLHFFWLRPKLKAVTAY
jgi:hypothetical protein